MIRKSLPLIFLFITTFSYAQEATYEKIKKLFYEDYEYEKVIQLSGGLLNSTEIDIPTRIDIYLMRAVSFFAFENNVQARANFENILRIDKTFTPDMTKVSPKAIALFNEVKTDFLRVNPMQATTPEDVAKIISLAAEKEALLKSATIKNILIPGWGHISSGATTKGIVVGGLSAISLASMIYYVFDTNKKEDAYLKETNKLLVEEKYSAYNNSYKTRNVLIGTYVALWLYSQIDLHFFNDALPDTELLNAPIQTSTNANTIGISFRIDLE